MMKLILIGGVIVCVLLAVFFVARKPDKNQRKQEQPESISKIAESSSEHDTKELKKTKQVKDTEKEILIIDSHTGITVQVKPGGRVLAAKDKNGKAMWSVDIIAKCGVPAVGKPIIRNLSVKDNKINVVFGKHSFASIDIETGQVDFLGAD